MAIYLNTNKSLENFHELFHEEYFVDKSNIIGLINKKILTKSKYVCITRPRRFGKSSVADMLGAYYSKSVNSKDIFDKLKISKVDSYEENLNKYNVISISFNEICEIGGSYADYIKMIRENIKKEIYTDFSFHSRRLRDIPFILELKKDDTPQNAIKQIRDKEYVQKFEEEYKGRKILAVGICYNSKSKEHSCLIEEITPGCKV